LVKKEMAGGVGGILASVGTRGGIGGRAELLFDGVDDAQCAMTNLDGLKGFG